MFSAFRQDLVFAIRQFRRNPGFTATVVLTLALGIGATTAIFSLVDGILLRPLPFPQVDRLVAIDTLEFPPGVAATDPAAAGSVGASYPNYFDWRQQNHTFQSLASCDQISRLFSKRNGEGARVISGSRVSANLFPTLGVFPAMGRDFVQEEELPGHRVVILSHELWVSDFGASANVVGETVKISDDPYIVIGVMPSGFHYPIGEPALFWSTFSVDAEGVLPGTSLRDDDRLFVIGRLKAGVQRNQALADLNIIQRNLSQQYSENRYRLAVSVAPLLDETVSGARSSLGLLLAAVGVLLIIGCANVAGLVLARGNRRRSELALRAALGASRFRVLRQLLIEALILGLGGGVVGILMSFTLLRAGLHFVPADLPRVYDVTVDGRVLAFAILLSAGTALLFGLLPAWKMSRSDPANALREIGPTMTSGRSRNRLHHALVVAETALGFALLIASGLLIRSMVNMLHLEAGFDTDHTVFFDVALTNIRYPVPGKARFYDKLLPELAAIPGVERIGSCHPLPIRWGGRTHFTIAGHSNAPDDLPDAVASAATPGYFETLSIPLVRGRTFTLADNNAKSARVAVINRKFAQQYFPGEDPIGHYFTPKPDHSIEPTMSRQIVGIVGDTRTGDAWDPYQPQYYLPYAQDPAHQRPLIVLKVSGDPLSYENAVRRIAASMDEEAPVFGYSTFTDSIANDAAEPRFEAVLVSSFAGMALLLSAVGLYAVLSFIVAAKSRELGLRMALGATRGDVLRLVLRRGLVLAGAGIAIGALISIFTTRLIADTLFNVAPLDRSVFLAVAVLLICVSVMAALGPALRAASVDPMRTLREQ